MNPRSVLRTAALALTLGLLAAWAHAAGPTRVARLGYMEGDVSFLEAGDTEWVQATLNRPLTTGDHLWTDRSAVAELQLGGAAIRMGERSNLTVLNLDERITQLQLSQGAVRLRLRVRALDPDQSLEVDTPNLAMVLRRAGDYRIEVDPQGDATVVLVQSGQADVFGEGASYRVDRSQGYRFYGTDLSDFEGISDYRPDALDRWAQERERRIDNSASARYVPSGVVGFEDLDANGRWVVDASYGNVWLPTRVATGWTPYRDGRWTWVEPWGWTWIDDAPWGYAVSHYGRWAYLGNTWGWVPGAARERVVYAPALVVFVGGNQGHDARRPPDRRSGPASTGWFPLGPREFYRPGQVPAREGYANQRVQGAVVASTNWPREREPQMEARSRPPRDNHPVVAATAPPTPAAPLRPGVPAEQPVRVRVVTNPAAVPIALPLQGPRSEAPRGEGQRPDGQRGERRGDVSRPAVPATPAAPVFVPIGAPVRLEPPRNDAARNESNRGDAGRADASRNQSPRAEAIRAEAIRAEANREEAGMAEVARAEAARNAAAQAELAKARATQEQAARAAEANRNNAARAEAVRAEAARNEAARNEAVRAEAARADAARAAAARAEAAKADAARAEQSRAEQARQPGRNAEGPRGNAQRPERELTPEEELLLKNKRKP